MFLLKIYFRFHVFLYFFFANNKQNKSNGPDSAKPGQAPHIKFPKKDSLLFKPAKSNYETRLKRFSLTKCTLNPIPTREGYFFFLTFLVVPNLLCVEN